jgi:Cdc6-like AAA superfamily ATPase
MPDGFVAAVMGSFCSTSYLDDLNEIKAANATTCEWIWEEPFYQSWKESSGSQILHIVGKPGQGKTVMAKHVFNRLREAATIKSKGSRGSRVLYYFCNSRKHAHETAAAVLRAIIQQLLREIPSLFETFLESGGEVDTHPFSITVSGTGWSSLNGLLRIFLDMVTASRLEEVYCIIDALDENDQDSVEEFLEKLVARLDGLESRTDLKLFITSRPEEYILSELEGHLQIRMSAETVQRDISAFVWDQLQPSSKLMKRLKLKEQDAIELREELVHRSEGLQKKKKKKKI